MTDPHARLGPTPKTAAGRALLNRMANPVVPGHPAGRVHSDIDDMDWRAIIHDIEQQAAARPRCTYCGSELVSRPGDPVMHVGCAIAADSGATPEPPREDMQVEPSSTLYGVGGGDDGPTSGDVSAAASVDVRLRQGAAREPSEGQSQAGVRRVLAGDLPDGGGSTPRLNAALRATPEQPKERGLALLREWAEEAKEGGYEWVSMVRPDDLLALLDSVERSPRLRATPEPPQPLNFPDHTHRWQERSQEALDAEYRETGAMLGRWYCPGCYEETMVEPDSVLATPDLDATVLANIIREVDGNHDLGADELAERIIRHPRFRATPEPPDPYHERGEHERQSLAGTHHLDPHCPFCFFDHFDAETRAAFVLNEQPEPPDLSAALVELPPTVEATPYSPWFTASCVQRCGLWAGFGGSDEMAVVAEAVAHVLDEGHETAVARESSVHYRSLLAQQPETGRE